MRTVRGKAQALVELALIAPVLIVLAMAVWDGGSVLRDQLILDQAARDGARVAATGWGTSVPGIDVRNAVFASAGELPGLNSPGNVTIIYSPNSPPVQVVLSYKHALVTPVLRQLWGGGQGTITLSASATFYVPQLTPITATSGATPTPGPAPVICFPTPGIPPLASNTGYYVTLQLSTVGYVAALWTTDDNVGGTIQASIYAGNPFAGQPNPTPPTFTVPAGALDSDSGASNSTVIAFTPQAEPAGTYSVFFYKQGPALPHSSTGYVFYYSATCT